MLLSNKLGDKEDNSSQIYAKECPNEESFPLKINIGNKNPQITPSLKYS